MFLCNEVAALIRAKVANPLLSLHTMPSTVMHIMIFEFPWKGLIGKQAEFISQRIKNEAVYKNLFGISGGKML